MESIVRSVVTPVRCTLQLLTQAYQFGNNTQGWFCFLMFNTDSQIVTTYSYMCIVFLPNCRLVTLTCLGFFDCIAFKVCFIKICI